MNFLQFVNDHFVNLKHLVLDFSEHERRLAYNWVQKDFEISPHNLKNLVDYDDKFSSYDGKVKAELNHQLSILMGYSPKQAAENYMEQFKKEFQDFTYYTNFNGLWRYHCFQKSIDVKENLQLNIQIQLSYNNIWRQKFIRSI